MTGHGWIGVDFDGTLAQYESGQFPAAGEPLMPMVERVREMLARGLDVRIVTARADHPDHYGPVYRFCREQFGVALPVTDRKDFQMVELYDDRAVQVVSNDGRTIFDAAVAWVSDNCGTANGFALKRAFGGPA